MTPDAAWLERHVKLLRSSYRHWTAKDLLPPNLDGAQAVKALNVATFVVVSHGIQPDPIFNYANPAALTLFDMPWESFTTTPSRLSAEPMRQNDRDRLLARVTRDGYIDDYTGVRISGSGHRFEIHNATVWNLLNEVGEPYGQAALIREWRPLQEKI